MANDLIPVQKNEIVVYQPNETLRLEVRVEQEQVWLNRQQMAKLFGRDVKTIGKHIANALKEELSPTVAKFARVAEKSGSGVEMDGALPRCSTVAKFATVQKEGGREVVRRVEYYGIDMVLSVGYRVKSPEGVLFRIWANEVLKRYMTRGFVFNERMNQLEDKVDRRLAKHDADIVELKEKVDFFVQTSQPPVQGVFYNGQVFDAHVFAAKHILSAKKSILLIDSWVDIVTLELLTKKAKGVTVEIVSSMRGNKLKPNDIATFNAQYGGLSVRTSKNFHDRFLIIDNKELYLIGASLKDLGRKCFAFTKLDSGEISGLKARI